MLLSFCRRSTLFEQMMCVMITTQILAGLAQAEGIDWSSTKIYFADERCVPLDHSDRYTINQQQCTSVGSWVQSWRPTFFCNIRDGATNFTVVMVNTLE